MKGIALPLLLAAAFLLATPAYAQVTTTAMTGHLHTAAADNTRLAALVPAGLSPEDACRGFGDLGACSAALHAAQNLNIPFADLKDRLTSGQSLATVIHAFKPRVDSHREAQRAEKQAREDLAAQG